MTAVRAEATRWVDDHQPGWVEVVLTDAHDNRWVVVEKVPVLGDESLTRDTAYPRTTQIPCEAEPEDAEGRVLVTLLHGIEAKGGENRFVVRASSVRSG